MIKNVKMFFLTRNFDTLSLLTEKNLYILQK